MTILSCQKRHHEPHWVHDYLRPGMTAEWCDGLPQWPYARPKPPCGNDEDYMRQHGTIGVWKSGAAGVLGPWDADQWCPECGDLHFKSFPTHAEAIQYAQKLVNERRAQDGTR